MADNKVEEDDLVDYDDNAEEVDEAEVVATEPAADGEAKAEDATEKKCVHNNSSSHHVAYGFRLARHPELA